MNPRIVAPHLRCPVCARPAAPARRPGAALPARAQLRPRPAGLRGPERRPGRRTPATPPEMVAARDACWPAGTSRSSRPRWPQAAGRQPTGLVVDVGGRHRPPPGAPCSTRTRTVRGLALDVSKAALRRAARAHPRVGAVRADAWRRLPVADGRRPPCCSTSSRRATAPSSPGCCAPTAGCSWSRPAPTTSAELVARSACSASTRPRSERLAASLDAHFTLADGGSSLRRRCGWTAPRSRTVVGMGPSAWHRDPAAIDLATPAVRAVTCGACRLRRREPQPR